MAVEIIRGTILTSILIAAPLLAICLICGVLFNLIQVATSIQDPGFSSIPRFSVCAFAFLLLLPWMLNQMTGFVARTAEMIPRVAR
ncbi:flagellar biosynthetic protein FliQ [Bryobacter aggregatus]|uniref:flagellar biosynthetic protein FliQ n=1 Tax=Bryobacter aggregatus TaxID=360054 RepID=UPI00138DD520|nr:flagellar biosynthetic protein FliQ [Bryobacter aggregatus]